MQSIHLNLSAISRAVRIFVAGCICTFLLISYALPAYSATSKPTEGEANLTQIERKSQEAVAGKSPYDFDMSKQQDETHPGLNEIQGTADIDKMKRPENTQDVKSIADKVEDALENITGRN
jgi:hypothetical protein